MVTVDFKVTVRQSAPTPPPSVWVGLDANNNSMITATEIQEAQAQGEGVFTITLAADAPGTRLLDFQVLVSAAQDSTYLVTAESGGEQVLEKAGTVAASKRVLVTGVLK